MYKYCKTDYTLAHGSDVNLVSGTRQIYYRHQKSLFASPDKFVSNIRQVCFRHQTSLFLTLDKLFWHRHSSAFPYAIFAAPPTVVMWQVYELRVSPILRFRHWFARDLGNWIAREDFQKQEDSEHNFCLLTYCYTNKDVGFAYKISTHLRRCQKLRMQHVDFR